MIKFVSIDKAAEIMGVSRSWIVKLINRADIGYYQERGHTRGRILINVDSLNRYFEKHQIKESV